MAFRGIRPDLTYVTLRLTYVNHTETQHTYANRRKNGPWPKTGLTYVSRSLTYVRCILTYVRHYFPFLMVSFRFQTLVRTFLRLLTPNPTRTTSFNIPYSSLVTNHHHKHSRSKFRIKQITSKNLVLNIRGITHQPNKMMSNGNIQKR